MTSDPWTQLVKPRRIFYWKWSNPIWNISRDSVVDVGPQLWNHLELRDAPKLWGDQNCLCAAELTKSVYREHKEWKWLEERNRASCQSLARWEQDTSLFRLCKIQYFSLCFFCMFFLCMLLNTLYWRTNVRISFSYNQESAAEDIPYDV